jgi:Mce-associated membrane protein
MTDKTPKKPVVGSRTPASARRVAGRGSGQQKPPAQAPTPPSTPPPARDVLDGATPPAAVPPEPSARDRSGVLHRSRTTVVLAVLLSLLVLGGVAELVYLLDEPDGDAATTYAFDAEEPYRVPDSPISVPLVDWRNANEEAAKAVQQILTVNWKDYDQHLEDVASLMTDRFADEYTATATDTRERFVAAQADYEFAVVGSSVVHAAPDRVTSLLFLNQFVHKGEGEKRVGPEIYQVRVVVTTTRADDGKWLVRDLEAQ